MEEILRIHLVLSVISIVLFYIDIKGSGMELGKFLLGCAGLLFMPFTNILFILTKIFFIMEPQIKDSLKLVNKILKTKL